ncbi:MAG: hypothetical protein D6785_04090, partial [Planctomycetota bacterium]
EEIPAPLATLPGGAEIYGELFRPVSSAKVRRLVWDYEDSLQEAAWKKAKEKSYGFYKDVQKGIHWNELVMSQRAGILPLLGFAPIQLDSYVQKKGENPRLWEGKLAEDFPEFRKEIVKLAVGDITKPLRRMTGYALFYKKGEREVISQIQVKQLEVPYLSALKKAARKKAKENAEKLFQTIKNLTAKDKITEAVDNYVTGAKIWEGAQGRYRKSYILGNSEYDKILRHVWKNGIPILEGKLGPPMETKEGFYIVNVKNYVTRTKRLKARRIMISLEKKIKDSARKKGEKLAQKILDDLKKIQIELKKKHKKQEEWLPLFEKRFAEFVQKCTDDEFTKSKNGDIGWFDPKKSALDFVNDAFLWNDKLAKGTLIDQVIAGEKGFYIVWVKDKKASSQEKKKEKKDQKNAKPSKLEFRASYILISFDPKKRLTNNDYKKIEEEIKKKIRKKKKELAKIKDLKAREGQFKNWIKDETDAGNSEKKKEGLLFDGKWLYPQDFQTEEFGNMDGNTLFQLPKGSLYGPVKTKNGYSLFMVTETEPEEEVTVGDIFFSKAITRALSEKERKEIIHKKEKKSLKKSKK